MQQLSMHFQSFAQIPKVAELAGRVATLQRSLHMNVMREFELLGTGEESTNPLLLERLKACCLVTDALGYKVGLALLAIPGCRAAYSSASLMTVHATLHRLFVSSALGWFSEVRESAEATGGPM